jgi:putative membrane protein
MSDRDPRQRDVDARFVLANERTLLAWMRTALALLASGAGVAQFAHRLSHRDVVAALFLVLGVGAAILGAVRFNRADRLVRSGLLPRTGVSPYVLAGAVAVGGVGLLVAVLAHW